MEKYVSHRISDAAWTHDAVVGGERIGSVTEPIIINTESGSEYIATTLQYKQDQEGDRSSAYLPNRYKKEVYDYGKCHLYKDKESLKPYTIWDETAQISILAMPTDEHTTIFSAKNALNTLLLKDNTTANIVRTIVNFFPEQNFGLLGSRVTGLDKSDSDIDIFIYGGNNFKSVTDALRYSQIQSELNLRSLTDAEQHKYALDYSKRFQTEYEKAKRIALLRSRYKAKTKNDQEIKIAFSGAFDKTEYQMQTILGSQKIKKISEVGIATNVTNSVSFPREYIVEINGERIRVIAMQWVLQRLVEEGDTVNIRGNLRQRDGVEFIALEGQDDIIISA